MSIIYIFFIILIINTSAFASQNVEYCFDIASNKYAIPKELLKAIAHTESNFNPYAINNNSSSNYDIGIMQINSSHLNLLKKRFNISKDDLFNPCVNIQVGSWILANNFVQYGYTWNAIGAYNASSLHKRPKYIKKIQKSLEYLNGKDN